MKLTDNLKKQVEATATKDDAREAIRKAGMILDDAELDQVTGGEGENTDASMCVCDFQAYVIVNGVKHCVKCGKPKEKPNPLRPGYSPNAPSLSGPWR